MQFHDQPITQLCRAMYVDHFFFKDHGLIRNSLQMVKLQSGTPWTENQLYDLEKFWVAKQPWKSPCEHFLSMLGTFSWHDP
jgi:hypothetical protein